MSVLRNNILYNLIGQTVVIILGIVSFKYIYSGLGEDALGIIYFSLMMSALLTSALDMGLSKTTVREIAANNIKEPNYIIKLTQTFSLIYWLAFIIVTVVFIFLLPDILKSWVNLTTMDADLAYYVLIIIGPTMLLAIPKSFLSSVCIGLQRMDINNSIDISVAIAQQLGMIILLFNNSDIIDIAYWLGLTNIVRIFAYIYYTTKLLSLRSMLPWFSMRVIKRIKSYTSNMMLISLVLVIHKQLDKVLVSKFLPIGIFGIYSFIFTSISKTSMITGAVTQAVFPHFAELDKQGEVKQVSDRFFILQDFLVFGTVPIFAGVMFFSLPLFTYLLDAEKALTFQFPVIFLSISFYLSAILRLSRIYMFSINKPEMILKSDVLSLFIVIPLTTFLVINMGIDGAAFAWIMFYGVLAVLIVPRVYKKEFNISSYFWFKSVISAVVIACVIYIPAWIMVETYFNYDLLAHILIYICASIIYAVCSLNMTGNGFQRVLINYLPVFKFMFLKKKS